MPLRVVTTSFKRFLSAARIDEPYRRIMALKAKWN
jgi:hypothetical protein